VLFKLWTVVHRPGAEEGTLIACGMSWSFPEPCCAFLAPELFSLLFFAFLFSFLPCMDLGDVYTT